MPKPSSDPKWATTGDSVTPADVKQNTGWVAGEKIPAQWLNWWMNLVYQWVLYLKNLTSESLDWTAEQFFSGGLTSYGNTVVNGDLTVNDRLVLNSMAVDNSTTPLSAPYSVAGQVNIPAGSNYVTVTTTFAVDPTQVSFVSIAQASEDATLVRVRCVVSSGAITIYGNAAATAKVKVNWVLFGRLGS